MSIHTRLLYSIAASLFALAVSGCESPRDRAMVLSSLRIETGWSDGDIDRGKRDWSEDSSWVALSIAPFAYLEPPKQVQVVATHAAYPEPVPCGR